MDSRGFESINVIPFIDIMLVLLTIVLTTSTFIATGAIGVRPPQASPSSVPMEKSLRLEIDRSGQIYLEGNPVELAEMEGLLAGHNRETAVLIRADRQLALQGFVDVMDRMKQLGYNRISLQTEASP
ncbi:MAG: ExbD/TolR family protein [Desulfuromonadales bacterium]|uniref:ExbD/TolR family protein n=1 Tax=Desulfuromonas sp. KJ2020 TaxID=2919173 RepID=UPI0020A79EBD|nr:biopolymer transporter ExbD [Desulfuromonas sp. KJ2020]